MKGFKILTVLYCMDCLTSDIFMSSHPENYYDECTCGVCGRELDMANTFGQIRNMKKPSDLTITSMGNMPSFGPASDRMAALNISCEESVPLLKRSHT
jgi:hypothetical protein